MFIVRLLILPLYPILLLAVYIKNILFDLKIAKSTKTAIPSIVVGNLKVGGTGKTPFVNLLINELKYKYNIALVSRGYGRKTSGYILADHNSTSQEIGDEPKMLYKYNPSIKVAVCEKRVVGVERLLQDCGDIDLIILDDAMQHRQISASGYTLLTEYDRPYSNDYLFPLGWLRDLRGSANRADIVVVTKSPKDITVEQMDIVAKKLKIKPHQSIFFTTTVAHPPVQYGANNIVELGRGESIVMLSAIASPVKFIEQLAHQFNIVGKYIFKDHHRFSYSEIKEVIDFAKSNEAKVVVTAKDIVKIEEIKEFTNNDLKQIYVQDISFEVLDYRGNDKDKLIEIIGNYE